MTLKSRSMQLLLVGATLLWCVGFGYWLWVTPVQMVERRIESSTSQASSPAPTTIVRSRSFAELSGPGPVVIPVVLAGLASLAAVMKWPAVLGSVAVLLLVFAMLTAFSVGLGYVPAAAAVFGAWMISGATSNRTVA
jgi:hypothetical protein